MTLDQLIEDLSNLSAAGHGEAQIRLAHQPSYPHEYNFGGMKLVNPNEREMSEITEFLNGGEGNAEERYEAQTKLEELTELNEHIIYFLEGSYIGYASKDLWDEDN
jgi:hypothetical protein